MSKALSMDLRERIVEEYSQGGVTYQDVAEQFWGECQRGWQAGAAATKRRLARTASRGWP